MNIISTETHLMLLRKLSLLAKLLDNFSDSKKQIKHIKKIIFLECKNIKIDEYFLNKKDFIEIDIISSELKEIAVRFIKQKNTDDYNRAKELLNRFNESLSHTIEKNELIQEKDKANALAAITENKCNCNSTQES